MKSLRPRKSGEKANLEQWAALTADRRWYFDHGNRVPDIAKIRIAFDSSSAALVLCNLSGQIVIFNKRFQDLFQLQQQESIFDQNIVKLCAPSIDISFIDGCATDGATHTEVKVLSDLDGNDSFRVLITAKRIDGSEGVPRWLMVTFTQLSEQSARTMAVQQLQMDFSIAEVMSGITHWFATVEPESDLLDFPMVWSLGASNMFAVDHHQLPATIRDWLATIADVDRDNVYQQLQAILLHGSGQRSDYRMNIAGAQKVFSGRNYRISDPFDSSRYLLLGTERDVTAEYSLHQELQLAISGFKMLFDSSEWAACVVDQRLNLMYMNDSLGSLLGDVGIVSNEKLVLLNLFDSIQKRRAILRNFRRAIEGSRLAQEIVIADKTDKLRRYDFNFTPVKNRRGNVIAVSILGRCVGSNNHGHYW